MRLLPGDIDQAYNDWCWSVKMRLYKHKLTQKWLAQKLGMDRSNLSKILSCVIEPGLSFYFVVEDVLKSLDNVH